jgi:DHA1 family multidrug resistance protein-like MFS transporter
MNKALAVLYASMFIVMTGYGLTLTVLPFYIERMALGVGITSKEISVHVGALTGVFALMQFFFAPLWGVLSDKVGRRPIFFVGLGGNAVFNILFGLGSNLATLYITRILGGISSSAVLPTANAYIADASSDADRGKGMAWLGTATGLGVVAGPALGAWLSWQQRFPDFSFGPFSFGSFSTSFFIAALLAVIALTSAAYMLPESLKPELADESELHNGVTFIERIWTPGFKRLLKAGSFWGLLCLSFLTWFSLALFEGTFALHGQQVMKFGPAQMGMVFMV